MTSTVSFDAPAEVPVPAPIVPPGDRLLGRRIDGAGGPRLICLAGLHGNEPAGLAAVERVFAALEGADASLQGGLVGLAGNLGALAAGRRFLDRDLNRLWDRKTLQEVRAGERRSAEHAELAAIDDRLTELIAESPGRVFLLDLHTTSGSGPAFAVLDDSLPNRRFAMALPVPLVLGLEEELVGTLVFHLTSLGVTSVAFEGGQHEDPTSVDRCEAAIWIALAAAGILPRELQARAEEARRLLRENRGASPHLVEVLYRHRVAPLDAFRMEPGFASFDEVDDGQALGVDRRGAVVAPLAGRLLMPLYQTQGDDGFFVVAPVRRFWFELSAMLRRWRVGRWLHLLPGVRRHPDEPEAYVVNRAIARWLVRDLFHLLGFKLLAEDERRFVFTRRPGGF